MTTFTNLWESLDLPNLPKSCISCKTILPFFPYLLHQRIYGISASLEEYILENLNTSIRYPSKDKMQL